jgi:hypothetical protein
MFTLTSQILHNNVKSTLFIKLRLQEMVMYWKGILSLDGRMSFDPFSLGDLTKLLEEIEGSKEGLNPEILASWYNVVEDETKALCPTQELRDTIKIEQDPIFPMKFKVDISKRAVTYFMQAIDAHLTEMPFATRLYFQKLQEIVIKRFTDEAKKKDDTGQKSQDSNLT